MTFIRSCNGKFKDKKVQKDYDDVKSATLIAQNTIEDFLFETIKPKLKATDIHYFLIEAILAQTKANLNLSRQAVLPMTVDLYEYTLKLLKSDDKEQKKQRKLLLPKKHRSSGDNFSEVFKKLTGAIQDSLSMLDGDQEMKTLYEYFINFSDAEIRNKLSNRHNIIDNELLDGFIACRNKYGFFLKQSYESELTQKQLQKNFTPNQLQEFSDRWNGIHRLITQDMYELHQRRLNAQSFTNVSQGTQNLFSVFGVYKSLNDNVEKLSKDINQKLDDLFSDRYLIESAKLSIK